MPWPFLTFLDAQEAWKPESLSKVEKEKIVPRVSGQPQKIVGLPILL